MSSLSGTQPTMGTSPKWSPTQVTSGHRSSPSETGNEYGLNIAPWFFLYLIIYMDIIDRMLVKQACVTTEEANLPLITVPSLLTLLYHTQMRRKDLGREYGCQRAFKEGFVGVGRESMRRSLPRVLGQFLEIGLLFFYKPRFGTGSRIIIS